MIGVDGMLVPMRTVLPRLDRAFQFRKARRGGKGLAARTIICTTAKHGTCPALRTVDPQEADLRIS